MSHELYEEKYTETATRTTDIRVEISPPNWLASLCGTEGYEAQVRNWAIEIRDFIRDHRSMDCHGLTVRLVQETYCTACGHRWEGEFITSEHCEGSFPMDKKFIGHWMCQNCGAYTVQDHHPVQSQDQLTFTPL